MTKKKPIELIEENVSPRALIVGEGMIIDYLSNTLKDKDCLVEILDQANPPQGKFDYIFQFSDADLIPEIRKKYLKANGKFLFIESDGEEIKDLEDEKIGVLRLGNIEAWNLTELTERILKTLFAKKTPVILDLRRKSRILKLKPVVVEISLDKEKTKTPETIKSPPKSITAPPFARHFRLPKIFFPILISLIIIILAFVGSGYWYVTSLSYTFLHFQSHLASSNWNESMADLEEARKKIEIGRVVYQYSYKMLIPFQETSLLRDIGVILTSTDDLLRTSEETISYFQNFQILGTPFLADLRRTSGKIDNFVLILAKTKKNLETISLPFFPKESFTVLLNSSLEKLSVTRQLLPLMEKLLTADSPKIYLVLFQNNMELRPTGGFIGSYALMTVEKGKMRDLKIMDVYTADGQLKGHVEPPVPIRKYLSQPNWFLRDSNFDPDFAVSAVKAAWFLQKEMGTEVDGVIGVNLIFMQQLLRTIGPVTLTDFNNEIINADNFFFKAQYFAQNSFFPGSTQKKDYLTALTRILLTKLEEEKNTKWLEILKSVKISLDEKNILLYSRDEAIQQLLEKQSWAGRVVATGCVSNNNDPFTGCYPDFLLAVEANLGVNKVNYFVSKSVAIQKKINENGQMVNTVTFSYENKSVPGVFAGGHYINYLRLFVPAGSKLLGVTLNNAFISPPNLDVEAYLSDKTVIGFLIDIPPDGKGIVKVSYTLPNLITPSVRSYQFFFQKQAGDKTSPLIFSLIQSPKFKFKPLNFKSTAARSEEIFYTTDTSVDRIFALERD